jgi:hypothetical protein
MTVAPILVDLFMGFSGLQGASEFVGRRLEVGCAKSATESGGEMISKARVSKLRHNSRVRQELSQDGNKLRALVER